MVGDINNSLKIPTKTTQLQLERTLTFNGEEQIFKLLTMACGE